MSSRLAMALVLSAMLAPLLIVGATLAHTHDAPGIGLYNEEHDLVLMGVLGSIAALPTLVVAVIVVVTARLVITPATAFDSSSRRLELSRAPPTA
jgi:hypothetical protein